MALTREEKALLDTIAYCEGTLGVSNNGYDVVVGYKIIAGWTNDTTIVHGGRSWYDKATNSTAAGRYQFLYDTWVGEKNINLPMNKENQDKKGIQLVNGALGKIKKSDLTNFNVFKQALNKLCTIWASIPVAFDIKDSKGKIHKAGRSYYSKDGINKSKTTPDKIFEVYKLALTKYK